MIRILVTAEFEKLFAKLSKVIQRKAERKEKVFRENPFHPSLQTEKLEPKNREVWSFRIDDNYRVIFRFIDGESALFLAIGPHQWIYRFKF